ncbi:MAG: carboxylesterase/lipase family protein [Selenomonadaceae bacterium]|nr:carboxylesterase/lipase family protein [Selenomonadaceae bacterium]MBR6012576.1 carboxylesterase/lipase family protein [Selenomonadaceae bacterium]
MKKIITIDDFIVAGISGIGYGLGFKIPQILGYEEWQCGVICLIVGMALDKITSAVVFSKAVQSSTANRIMTFLAYISICTAIEYAFMSWKDISIEDYAMEGYAYLVVPAILGFAFSMALRKYRIWKIRKIYGDGSNGFIVDNQFEKSEIDRFNQQNQQIHGEFDKNLAVKTKTGCFVGQKEKDTIFFAGIPYAKPPVGELRWKAPEPLPESENIFEAKSFGASAIQVDYKGSVLKHHRQSEDCLTLNICVENKKTARKKPVIVFFHHGDFSYGGSADPLLHGENFTKIYPDTVGVTFNYRLGILGFIDFSEIPGGENYPDAINLGLLDQIAALKWIKENISEFGGDPEKITVIGFESGALSISLLAACEKAKGLFQKAFIFYGNPLAAYETPETSRNLAKKLLQETSTTNMEELLQISTEKLKELSQKLLLNFSPSPTRDGKLIPVDFAAAYRDGAASGIEFIIGIPSNEIKIFKSIVGNKKYEDFMSKEFDLLLRYIDNINPVGAKNVKAYIDEQSTKIPILKVKEKIYEQFCALNLYFFAKKLAEGGNKVYILYWNVKPLIENLGSGTIDVLATFLGSRKAAQIYGNVLNRDIAETLQKLFKKFEHGDELKLFNNEIKGINAIDWKNFPNALIVSEKSFKCEPIADKLTDVDCLREIFAE